MISRVNTTSHRSFYQDLAIAIPHELGENDGILMLSNSLKLKLQNGTLRKHLANDLREYLIMNPSCR